MCDRESESDNLAGFIISVHEKHWLVLLDVDADDLGYNRGISESFRRLKQRSGHEEFLRLSFR